jgi:hypothetical protein
MAPKLNFHCMFKEIFVSFSLFNKGQNIKWSKSSRKEKMAHPRNILLIWPDHLIVRSAVCCVDRFEKRKQLGYIFGRSVMENLNIHCGDGGSLHDGSKATNQNKFYVRL